MAGTPNPYGLIPAGVLGVGVGVPIGAGRLLRVGARGHVILTDYGVREWSANAATVLGASPAF